MILGLLDSAGEMPGGAAPKKRKRRAGREFELGLLTAVLSQRRSDLDRREADLDALAKELEMLSALLSQPPAGAPAAAPSLPQGEAPWMPIQ